MQDANVKAVFDWQSLLKCLENIVNDNVNM